MKLNIKKLISGCVFAATGLLGFIFMALDYAFQYISSYSIGLSSGYGFIGFDASRGELAFMKLIPSILLVFVIISLIVFLALGTLKILDACGIEITFVAPYNELIEKISKKFLLAYLIINGASFIFTLIWGLANTKSAYGYSTGVAPGPAAYLLLIFAAIAFAAPILLDKYMPEQNAAQPKTVFVCTQCGKKCANGAKFCDACGGAVAEKVVYPVAFVCSKCGKKCANTAKFCDACGGEVVKKELRPVSYACSKCGKAATAEEKFCGACGGEIIQK